MKKIILSILFSSSIIFSSSVFSKTKVSWSMESNADRDPIMLEKLQNVYNASQDNYELVIEFEDNETRLTSMRTAMIGTLLNVLSLLPARATVLVVRFRYYSGYD